MKWQQPLPKIWPTSYRLILSTTVTPLMKFRSPSLQSWSPLQTTSSSTSVLTVCRALYNSHKTKWLCSITRQTARVRVWRSYMFLATETPRNSGRTCNKCPKNGTRWHWGRHREWSRCLMSLNTLKWCFLTFHSSRKWKSHLISRLCWLGSINKTLYRCRNSWHI